MVVIGIGIGITGTLTLTSVIVLGALVVVGGLVVLRPRFWEQSGVCERAHCIIPNTFGQSFERGLGGCLGFGV
jgi:hypothetical protein